MSSSSHQPPLTTLKYILRDFVPDPKMNYRDYGTCVTNKLKRSKRWRSKLPQTYMIYFLLVRLLNFKYWGRGEKVAWEIPVLYKGVPFLMAHRKFGLDIQASAPNSTETIKLVRNMMETLNKAAPVADALLEPYANEQVDKGAITLRNKYHLFDMMYKFFRQKAERSFHSPSPKKRPIFSHGNAVGWTSDIFKPEREGFFFAYAMMDAYFSRLEHILVLSLPFTTYDHTKNKLSQVLSSTWSDKYKLIFDLDKERSLKALYESLREIKERFRNRLSHGGFVKKGNSLSFHSPIGAVPIRLSKEPKQDSFHPIDNTTFEAICNLFDKVDKALANHRIIKFAHSYINAGLDVAFDEKSRQKYQKAMNSQASFYSLIEHDSYVSDMHTNMDF